MIIIQSPPVSKSQNCKLGLFEGRPTVPLYGNRGLYEMMSLLFWRTVTFVLTYCSLCLFVLSLLFWTFCHFCFGRVVTFVLDVLSVLFLAYWNCCLDMIVPLVLGVLPQVSGYNCPLSGHDCPFVFDKLSPLFLTKCPFLFWTCCPFCLDMI